MTSGDELQTNHKEIVIRTRQRFTLELGIHLEGDKKPNNTISL